MPQKIAVCDDNDPYSELLKDFLLQNGYAVWRAVDAAQFAARVRLEPPDLVILDIQMAAGGGPAAAGALRSTPGMAAVPVVVCSGVPVEHQKNWFRDIQNIRFVQKPAALPRLLEVIRELLPPSPG